MRRIALALLYALCIHAHAGDAPADPLAAARIAAQGLTREQAQAILMLVLRHQHVPAKPTLEIEHLVKNGSKPEDIRPGYYSFGVTSDSPNMGASNVWGMYAVSRYTGDVWESFSCRRYRFAKLRRLQATIMKKTGKSFLDERQERLMLGCSDD
jgi:hypothetical protein